MPVPDFTKLIIDQLDRLRETSRHRLFLVVEGDQPWATQAALQVFEQCSRGIWIGAGHAEAIPASKAKHLLGQSSACVVFNAFDGFHPNAFAAVAGCVEAGGCLILIVPSVEGWSSFQCPDYERMAVHGAEFEPRKYFLERLSGVLASSPKVWHWSEQQGLADKPVDTVLHSRDLQAPYLSLEQADAVAAIQRVATGHRKRPLVLMADRGRGKSASLGFAAAELLAQGKRVGLVAPTKAAVAPVFEFSDAKNPLLSFYSPDFVDIERPEVDILLVDEAAAIPVTMLLDWAQYYPRVVYSTTVQGYEGHGQGFVQRFLPALKTLLPQMRFMQLSTPIRWGLNCPVEAVVNDMLLLDVSDQEQHEPRPAVAPILYECVSREVLAQRPSLLRQVYRLLVAAHYQTTPDDVRTLLDGPNIQLCIASQANQVVGVVMVAEEGALPEELFNPIFAGLRRVRGHLAPQFMAVNGSHTQWLGLRSWRIVRIAVAEAHRRDGVGRALIKFVESKALEHRVDALTTVFGWTPALLGFWAACGFTPQAFTTKRDSVTATLSGCLVKPLGEEASSAARGLSDRFIAQWCLAVSHEVPWVSVELFLRAVVMVPSACRPKITALDLHVLEAFASGRKHLAACRQTLLTLAVVYPEQVLAMESSMRELLLAEPIGLTRRKIGVTKGEDRLAWLHFYDGIKALI